MDRATLKTTAFGFLGALFLLTPFAMHDLYDTPIPFLWWMISNGAVYVKIFFHELGHTAFMYYYGHLALPMFMPGGGGLTMGTPQFIPLALGMSALLFYTTRLNRDNGFWFWLVVFLLIFQLATFFTDFHESVVSFMGHGTEIILGGYMLYRALLDLAHNATERWANALFGFFMIFYNLYQGWGLAFVPAVRQSYIDAHANLPCGAPDFIKIAETMNVSLGSVALCAFAAAIVALVVPFILWERDEDWYEESEERFPV
jgi:hypothetical protein